MGILNVTPDSFSDGGRFLGRDEALAQARAMVEQGASYIDVGGESTRPGARPASLQEELDRVIPVVEALCAEFPTPVSIDTRKAAVMREAVAAGAAMINDVNALRGDGALEAAAALGVDVCLMHMRGDPTTMQDDPRYDDVVPEVLDFLLERVAVCEGAGLARERLFIDPGFGFGKTLAHNQLLLAELHRFVDSGVAVLVGLSRKSMIAKVLDRPVAERLHGSVALAVIAAMKGAAVVRVHDVGPTMDAVKMVNAVLGA